GEDADEPQRLLTELRPHPVVAGGRRIALVEDEIDDRQHRGETGGKLLAARHLERHARLAQGALSAHDALLDGRLRHEEGAGNLLRGQSAQQAERQRRARLWREDRVAGDEDEAEEIVANVVERRVEVWRCVLLDLQLVTELGVLAVGELVAAEEIDRPMLGGGHQPGARLFGHAWPGPFLDRSAQRVLGKLLSNADIAHHAREAGNELRLLDPEHRLDGAMRIGRRHGDRFSISTWPGQGIAAPLHQYDVAVT